jgi:hypothetical protein
MMTNWGLALRFPVVALMASICSACSFLVVRPAPRKSADGQLNSSIDCTQNNWAPNADVMLGMGELTGAGVAFVEGGTPPAIIGLGAAIAAVFVGSAVYGYSNTTRCHARNRVRTNAPTSPGAFPIADDERARGSRASDPWASLIASGAQQPDVPKTVDGFTFATTIAVAEQVCTVTQRAWELEGRIAKCDAKGNDSGANRTRLEFELGSLAQIVFLYDPAQGAFNRDYDALHEKLRVRYGKPQAARAPLTGDCATALPECMQRGEMPSGSTWHLRSGRIVLQPLWRDNRAFIEERYTREEPPAQ